MKINDTKSFGNMIRERRKELHYTQAEISENSGLSVSFLSDLENGKSTIELGKALFVAQLLGLDMMLENRGKG